MGSFQQVASVHVHHLVGEVVVLAHLKLFILVDHLLLHLSYLELEILLLLLLLLHLGLQSVALLGKDA